MASLFYFLVKKGLIEKKIILKYKKVVIATSLALTVVLRQYQLIIVGFAFGNMPIHSGNTIIFIFSLLVIMTIIMFLTVFIFKYMLLKNENEYVKKFDEIERIRHQELMKGQEKMALLVHDVKNHFIVLREYSKLGESEGIHQYLEEIHSEFIETPLQIWSGNKVLDFIINQKYNVTKLEAIKFSIQIEWMPELKFNESEICVLFGNLLDNAIEECLRIENEDKWITVSMKKKNSLLLIAVFNSCNLKKIEQGKILKTAKLNKTIHGYGLKSVKNIVDKYKGELDYTVKENVFQIILTFFDL